jgi:LuxR family maltose regulon positive regulatory protein
LEAIRENGIRVSTAGNMDVVLGGVLYEWNRLDEAEQSIRDGLAANAPWGNIMTDAFGMFALIKVLQSMGRYDEALQVVDRFEAKLQGLSRPVEFDEPVRTARARIWLAQGDLRSASEWADLAMKTDDYLQHPDLYRLAIAVIRCAQGRYQEVIDILNSGPGEILHGSDTVRMIEINLLRSLAQAGLGDIPTAICTLDACLAIAEPEGFVRIFVDYGEYLRPLLEAYLRFDRPKHAAFAKGIWTHLEPPKTSHPQISRIPGLLEPLSARELEVLQWMAAGKTNLEIAGQLIVARGTIKAHAANIFRKLDASNRTEAVANARRLGLIP